MNFLPSNKHEPQVVVYLEEKLQNVKRPTVVVKVQKVPPKNASDS